MIDSVHVKKSDRKANRFNCGRMSSILMYKSDGGETMLLLNKTLLRLARGCGNGFLRLPQSVFDACWNNSASGNCFAVSGQFVRATGGIKYSKSAVGAAFLASVFTFLAQLVKGLIEYKTAAKARSTMRKQSFQR